MVGFIVVLSFEGVAERARERALSANECFVLDGDPVDVREHVAARDGDTIHERAP